MKGKFFSNQKLKISIAIITIALIIGSVIVSLVSNKKISEEMNNLAESVKLSAATFNSYSEKIEALSSEQTKAYLYTLKGWKTNGRKRSYMSNYGRTKTSYNSDGTIKEELEPKWLFMDRFKELNDLYCVRSGTDQDDNYLVLDLYNLSSDENGLALIKEMFETDGDSTGEKGYKHFMWILENMYSIADDTSEIQVNSEEWQARFEELLYKIAKYRVDNNKVALIEGKTTDELIEIEYTNLSEMYKKVTNELIEYSNPSDEMKATANTNGTTILPMATQTTETTESKYTGNTILSMVYNLYNSWSNKITDEKPEINHYKTATIEARQALVRTMQNYVLLAMVNQTDGEPRQKYNITDNGVIDGKISTIFTEEYTYRSTEGVTKTGYRFINREIDDTSDTKKFVSYLYDYLIYGYETEGTNYDVNKYKDFTLDGGYDGKVTIEKYNLERNRTSYNSEQNKIGPFHINNKYNYDVELKILKGEEELSYTIQDTNGNTVTNISNLGTAEFNIILNQDYEFTDESEIKVKYNVNYGKVPQAVLLYPITENNEECRYQSMINLKKSPKTDSGELTVNITIQNIDLALKKVITKVNGVELKDSIPEYEAGVRFKQVNTDNLANKTDTNAQYTMNKTPVKVRVGDIVTYEIKIYNEGNTAATASEIQDYIPTGLQAKSVKYGETVLWENNVDSTLSSDANGYVTFDNLNNNVIIRYLSQLNLIEPYNKDTKTIDSETVIVECEVLPESTGVLTNIAQISEYTTEDENNTRKVIEKDIDSESNNWTILTSDRNSHTWKNYSNSQSNWLDNNDHEFKGQQDDDDFEKVIVEKFDLSLTKEIENVEREEQNVYSNLNRLRSINTTYLENGTNHTANYYMNKQPVEVMPNDIVTYKLRIYNEGKIDGVVKEVTDYLPTGLTFVDLVDEYKTTFSVDTEKTTQDKVVIKIGANGEGKTIPAYTNGTEMLKTSITVELKCKVENQENYDIELFNVAEITNYGYIDNNGNYKETSTQNVDIDSMEDTILTDTSSTTSQEIINAYKTKITDKINNYEENGIVDKTNLHYEDDDDFERLIVRNSINPIFDLSLRKFITKVVTKNSKGEEIVIETPNRYPYVDSYSLLKLNQKETAEYYHDKLKVQVNEGDLVTYKIRIYNEGGKLDYAGYAKEITDYLPTGLTFVDLVDEYKTENGGKYTLTQYNEEENKVIITYDGSEIIQPESINKIISSQTGAYQEVGLVCSVNTGTKGKLLTNRAEITKDVAGEYNSENNFVIVNNETEESIDRDSRPNTIKTDPDLDNWYWNEIGSEDLPKSYYPGVQDDDDFETVYVRNRKFDLSLRKFITKVNGVDVEESREPGIDTRSKTLLIQKGNASYYHKKGKVEVEVGDEVEYTIRVYNEGTVNDKTGQKDYAGYAGEITDYLPNGLKFVKIADEYDKSNGGKYELTKYDETQNKVVISYDGTQEILPNSISRIILNYTNESLNENYANEGTVGKEKVLYQEVAVICKVEESESTVLTNRAEITKYMCESNGYSSSVKGDIDSEPSIEQTGLNLTNWYYLNVDEQTDNSDKFYPGVQDDDDFDTVYVSNLYTGTQLELNKIGTSTESNIEGAIFNIQNNTETKMVLKTCNKTTMQELEKNESGYVTIPKDGAILDMQNLKYGGTYEILIQEIQAPEGYEKIFESIVLQISVSKEGTITAKIKTVNGEEYTKNSNKIVELVNANEQGEVTLSAKQKDYTIQYRKGENGEWEEYNAQTKAIIEKNTTVYGISVDENGNYSKMGIKEITNIDKIKPTIEKAEEKSSGDIETAISLTIKDTQTEEYGASGIQWYGLSKTQNDEPTQKISGNGETVIENVEISEISENGIYYIWVKDVAGNITKQEIEITGVATDVMVARIVSASNTSLVGTEYGTLAAALQAVEANGTATIEIIHDIYNEANSITENKNITIDLKGFTVQSRSSSKAVLTVESGSNLNIVNPSANSGGIRSVNNNGVIVNEGGIFTLGTDDNSVILAQPRIYAKEIGVLNNNGTFNFYDGQIEAITAIKGNVTETPVLYSVAVSQGETTQVATLNIISNVEARIGKKTYTTLEAAIEDANTAIGTDGSQVEIVVVTDLAKSNTVVIDESKNIKLNLDGHSVTTTSSGYVFDNYGKLEIVDTSEEKTGKIYSTTNDVIRNNETTYKGTEKISWNNIKNRSAELGFVEQDGKLVPTNIGVSNSEAEGVIEINLIGKTGKYLLAVNAQVSSQSNCDFGYATITKSLTDVPHSQTEGRFMHISGTVSARDYITYLEGGSKYYLHLGYYKDRSANAGDDKVTINNIYMINTDENGYKLDLSTVENTRRIWL